MEYTFLVLDSLFLWETSLPGGIFRILQAFHAGSRNEYPEVEFNVENRLFPDDEYPEDTLLGHLLVIATPHLQRNKSSRFRAVLCVLISPHYPENALVLVNTLATEKSDAWKSLHFGGYEELMKKIFRKVVKL